MHIHVDTKQAYHFYNGRRRVPFYYSFSWSQASACRHRARIPFMSLCCLRFLFLTLCICIIWQVWKHTWTINPLQWYLFFWEWQKEDKQHLEDKSSCLWCLIFLTKIWSSFGLLFFTDDRHKDSSYSVSRITLKKKKKCLNLSAFWVLRGRDQRRDQDTKNEEKVPVFCCCRVLLCST